MQSKLATLERAKNQPIAIIGIGCRFPGDVNSLDGFWDLLKRGIDAITKVPPEHWDIDEYYDPTPYTPGKIYTRHGGFLPFLYDFDAKFFRLSPREAVSLDPQQRLLLEVSWEALENAAIAPDSLLNKETGVFIGISGNDYWYRLLQQENTEIDAYLATGNSHSMAAGRISYLLGLTGPSLVVDTACSSSLVSVHLAVNSLRNQECTLAIAGGVNRLLSPEVSINFCQGKMLSPDGRCATFDESANGFVRAEGCGIVVLKRLDEAIADGDRLLAVIAGSAINHDGRSSGLTVPNGVAQQVVIQKALTNAQLSPSAVDYVETHGTGTSLGDPIEVGALNSVFGESHSATHPLLISSVKTNIGHCEAAAGIASLIKTVLVLQHGEIPPHLHLTKPNPYINWEKMPLKIPTTLTPWVASNRVAGVSSFGFSGTNAHIVLTEAPPRPVNQSPWQRPCHLFTLSAKSAQAVEEMIERYQAFLLKNPETNLGDLCFTANSGRSHFNHRLAIIANSIEDLQQQLTKLLEGETRGNLWQGKIKEGQHIDLAFICRESKLKNFNWGQQLEQTQPIFQAALQEGEALFQNYLGQSFLQQIYREKLDKKINKLAYLLWQYALLQLWFSWGIKPKTFIVQGIGTYVGAIAANIFNLETAFKLLATKLGILNQNLTEILSAINSKSPEISLVHAPENIIINQEINNPKYWLHFNHELKTTEMENLPLLEEEIYLDLSNYSPKLSNTNKSYLATLARQEEDWPYLLKTLAQLYIKGIKINSTNFDYEYGYEKIPLPSYPFQRELYRKA
jgi:acyl transferase domain-containing protein